MASNNPGGKGSAPRPHSVDKNTFANNWDNIFKKDKPVDTKPCENKCSNCQCKPEIKYQVV